MRLNHLIYWLFGALALLIAACLLATLAWRTRCVRRWLLYRLDCAMESLDCLQQEYDLCELCTDEKEVASYVCVGCKARVCEKHESGYYYDESLCTRCRAAITPEQEAEDVREAVADDCESGCHQADCPCTRVHAEHTGECAKCACQDFGPCAGHCKPSGYTGDPVSL